MRASVCVSSTSCSRAAAGWPRCRQALRAGARPSASPCAPVVGLGAQRGREGERGVWAQGRARASLKDVEASGDSFDDSLESADEAALEAVPAPVEAPGQEPAPKKTSGLVQRTLTACVLAPVAGIALTSGGWLYAAFVALISWFCTQEYIGMVTSKSLPKSLKPPPASLRRTMLMLCVGMVFAAQYGIRTGVFETAAFLLLSMLLVTKATKKKLKKRKVRFNEITALVFGLFYCGYLPTFWIRLRQLNIPVPTPEATGLGGFLHSMAQGGDWTVGLLATLISAACIVAADTGAYFGGKSLGQTPLISISPKKTVEGAVCGFLASLATALACCRWLHWPDRPAVALAFAATVFVASVFGDLIESSLKRSVGKKDSGSILPGHGGLLDRFDSYIFTGVLVYALVYWYSWSQGLSLSKLVVTPPR